MGAARNAKSTRVPQDLPANIALQLQLMQRMRDGLLLVDSSGEIQMWNAAAAVITGWNAHEARDRGVLGWQSGVFELRPGLWIDVRRFSWPQAGREYAAMLFSDCSSQVALREIRDRVGTDPLTGVATRRETLAHLERTLALGQRDRRAVGLLYVGVDDIATVAERGGIAAATQASISVAGRLARLVRKSDLVGRVGPDEFAVVLTAMREKYHARIAAVRLLLAVAEPMCIDGRPLSISCSIGVAEATEVDCGAPALLQRAYDSMLNARRFGGGFICCADEATSLRASDVAPIKEVADFMTRLRT